MRQRLLEAVQKMQLVSIRGARPTTSYSSLEERPSLTAASECSASTAKETRSLLLLRLLLLLLLAKATKASGTEHD